MASSCRTDNDGPTIVSVDVNDTTFAPGDSLVMRARLRDPAGVQYAAFMYQVGDKNYSWCGWDATRTSGTVYDGWWELSCVVPATARIGTYTVTPYAQDSVENWTNMNGGDESPLTTTFTVSGGTDDTAGPQILSVDVNDTTVAPGDSLVMRAAPPRPGRCSVRRVHVPGGRQELLVVRVGRDTDVRNCVRRLVELSCVVPATARIGTYTVTPYAQDSVENWTNMNGGDESPLTTTFTVSGGTDDTAGPQILSVDVNDTTVAPGDSLVMRARLRDPAGVQYAAFMYQVGDKNYSWCGWDANTDVRNCVRRLVGALMCGARHSSHRHLHLTPYAQDSVENWTNMNGGDESPLTTTFTVSDPPVGTSTNGVVASSVTSEDEPTATSSVGTSSDDADDADDADMPTMPRSSTWTPKWMLTIPRRARLRVTVVAAMPTRLLDEVQQVAEVRVRNERLGADESTGTEVADRVEASETA